VHPTIGRAAKTLMPPPLYREIRRRRIQAKIGAYQPRIVEHTYAGYRLKVHLKDSLAEGWYDFDWPDAPEIDLLREGRLREGARVFDLGAHQAIVALVLARIVGPTGKVVAVEAEPHNARVAEENRSLNGAENLVVEAAAVSDTPGTLYFSEGLNGMVLPGGRAGKVAVDAVTIDALGRRHGTPDVVFIDVEGYEGKALAGASETLASGKTDFFVELHNASTLQQAGTSAEAVMAVLQDSGYECKVARATDGPVETDWVDVTAGVHLRGDRCYIVAFSPASRKN
jgi:FkbM family methyltransferase